MAKKGELSMILSEEWTQHIDRFIVELTRNFYTPLADLSLEYFETHEQLPYEEAAKKAFSPIREGDRWGEEWQYAWFRAKVVVPPEAAGQRIVMKLDTGGESCVFVNGVEFGTRRKDWIMVPHHFFCDLTLTDHAKAGETFDIMLESYAGHFFYEYEDCAAGPVSPGAYSVEGPRAPRALVGSNTFGIWHEDAYALYLDASLLRDLLSRLDQNSLRAAKIAKALKDFTRAVDFETDMEHRLESFRRAREALAPALACENGSTAPVFYGFGHAHIDVCWLWTKMETERKCLRTFASQLRHMDRYPEYRFLQSEPALYELTKKNYPALFERIREKIKTGQWIADGAMWVEPDTNITGGESLIRQFLFGKRYFKEEFGVDSEIAWLPDVFGYTAALPKIMKGCGVRHFATCKIFWNYNGGEPFPYNHFMWRGHDGSEIEVFLHSDYNAPTTAAALIDKWNERSQKEDLDKFIVPFGYGDGGGGPSRDHIELALRQADLEGCPKFRFSSPAEFFQDITRDGTRNTYTGELYFPCHRGTYTSQARIKRLNRSAEYAMREAELWGAAYAVQGGTYARPAMDELWKTLLFNQFHDILPGSSIARVNREAEAELSSVVDGARKIADNILGKLLPQSGLSAANALSWERDAIMRLPDDFQNGGVTADGTPIPTQATPEGVIGRVHMPSLGITAIKPKNNNAPGQTANVRAYTENGVFVLENDVLRAEFGTYGEITRLYDKSARRLLNKSPLNRMRMFRDIPRKFDAWDIDSLYVDEEIALTDAAELEVLYAGPLEGALRIRRKIGNSSYVQTVRLESGCKLIRFETTVEWHELHKLLKVAFPFDVHADSALHEIQFGHIRRPNDPSTPYNKQRFEVCNHKWTAFAEEGYVTGVLNNCKYGVGTLYGSIDLTLLRAAACPEMGADQGEQTFTYALYAFDGSFAACDIVRNAYELNIPARLFDGCGAPVSLLTIDQPGIIADTVKPAEDGCGVVVRLYESKRTACRTRIRFGIPVREAYRTDMLENILAPVDVKNGEIELEPRPFEVVTLKLVP